MAKIIKNSDIVEKETIKLYSEIDPLFVLEELMLNKGEQVVNEKMLVDRKLVDYMSIISYGLKFVKTNELYVGMHLDKYFQQNDMIVGNKIKVPRELYEKCKAINESFRNR